MRMVNELTDIRGKSPLVEENPIEASAKVAVKQWEEMGNDHSYNNTNAEDWKKKKKLQKQKCPKR